MTYEELKKLDKRAHSALITLWEELSRVSRETARRDLKENWGFRYEVSYKPALTFRDADSGDTFAYNGKEWI